jgi:serine protease Do
MKTCFFLGLLLVVPGISADTVAGRDSQTSKPTAMEVARLLNEAFVAVAEKASPSVVVISVVTHSGGVAIDIDGPGDAEEMSPDLRRFLEEHLPRKQADRRPRGELRTGALAFDSQGSGIVLRADGYLLTNRHVVEDADQIQVRFSDGMELPAEVRGVDTGSDLAVLRVRSTTPLTPAVLGDSSRLRVGEFAIAIGAPFDLDYSVTFGHVSAKGRNNVLSDRALDQDFIQTDAQINPGNSGGPLVNIAGEVIGINTLIRGMHTGIGFAIPINQAREVAEQLIEQGRYLRTWLGIGIRSLRENPSLRDAFPDVRDGVVVKQIEAAGPARKSELRAGDLITGVDGHPVATVGDLKTEVRSKRVGDLVTLDVVREGKLSKVRLKAEAMPDKDHPATPPPAHAIADEESNLGIAVKPLSAEQADHAGIPRDHGVLVSEVTPGSVAELYGMKPGSVITEMNRRPVNSPRQFRDILHGADLRKGLQLTYTVDGVSRFEFIRVEP